MLVGGGGGGVCAIPQGGGVKVEVVVVVVVGRKKKKKHTRYNGCPVYENRAGANFGVSCSDFEFVNDNSLSAFFFFFHREVFGNVFSMNASASQEYQYVVHTLFRSLTCCGRFIYISQFKDVSRARLPSVHGWIGGAREFGGREFKLFYHSFFLLPRALVCGSPGEWGLFVMPLSRPAPCPGIIANLKRIALHLLSS